MKILSKIIVSSVIFILAIIVYFLPEISTNTTSYSNTNNDLESYLMGDNSSYNSAVEYGRLDLNLVRTRGFDYVRNRQKEKTGFGLIEFKNKSNDSAYVNSLKSMFITDDIKVYRNSGIVYAFINRNQIYIDNSDVTEINGFNGRINLALVVNTEGFIDSLIYLSSEETSSYLYKINKAGYFNQYSNLLTDEQHTIDAVAGATITSVAIAKAVNEIFTLSQHEVLSDYMIGNYSSFNVVAKLNKIWIVNLIFLIIIFSILSFKRFRKRRILTLISVFTVLWLGLYLNSSFTYLLFIKPFTSTGLSIFTIAYILLTLVSTVWFKNTYCKYVCPFGNAQKLMYKVSPFKKRNAIFKNRHLKIARYIISLFIIAGYLSGLEMLSEYELFPYLFSANIHSVMFGISILIILISMRIPKLWCRALCPTGCLLDTVSGISENKIKFKIRTS